MDVAAFNAAAAPDLAPVLLGCVSIPSWGEALTAGRPYPDRDTLLARAEELAAGWGVADLDCALAAHPRIGERGPAPSQREQSGVGSELAERLAAGNAAYEQKFGRVFLVRAAGRGGEEILQLLEKRLAHDPLEELAQAVTELREITLLRLQAVVT